MKPVFHALALVSLAACASTGPALPESSTVDLREVRRLIWEGESDAALLRLNDLGWKSTGSIASERLRQDLRIARGERGQVLTELQEWGTDQAENVDPDLLYLRHRLLEDPERRFAQLREALNDWPRHEWLRLGSAATAQTMGEWGQARNLLGEIDGWEDASFFRRVVLARQLAHDDRPLEAFQLIEEDAFERGDEAALLTWLRIADTYRDTARSSRARTAIAVRRCQAWEMSEAERIDVVFARLQAEWPWLVREDLDASLEALDRWAQIAGVASGWEDHPRYTAPPFAELVRPEPTGGGPASAWADSGRVLLAGAAMGRGTEIHLLTETEVLDLAWPGQTEPLEILVSRGALSASSGLPQGGAVLRGFFLRLDEAEANARSINRSLKGFVSRRPQLEFQPEAGRFESWDLPKRLRLQAIQSGVSSDTWATAALAVHEAGHLPETLPWTRYGVPVIRLLPSFVGSLATYGDPVLWLEYRAQARALASGRATGWLLAEIVERSNEPQDAYHAPYRALLRDLVKRASEEGMPHLAHWDEIEAPLIAALARALCIEEGIELLPEAGLSALDVLIEQLDTGN